MRSQPTDGIAWKYKYKVRSIIFLLILDIASHSIAQPLFFTQHLASAVLSVTTLLLQALLLLTLLWDTTWLKYGLIGFVLRKMSRYLLVLPFHLGLTIVIKIMRLKYATDGASPIDVWDDTTYYVLYSLQKFVFIVYVICLLETVFDFANPEMYTITEEKLRKCLKQHEEQKCCDCCTVSVSHQ